MLSSLMGRCTQNHRRALFFSCDVVMRRDAHPKIPHEDEEPSLEVEVLGMNDPLMVAGSLFPWGLESVHGFSLFTVPGPRSRVSGNLALQMLYGVAARFWSLFRGVGHRQFWGSLQGNPERRIVPLMAVGSFFQEVCTGHDDPLEPVCCRSCVSIEEGPV